jgi:hypothetical protein
MAGDFLFEMTKIESRALDMRSNFTNKEMLQAVLYYGSLNEAYGIDKAKNIKDFIERCLIGIDGKGREQGVEVLRQNFPKKVEVEHGYEGDIKESE